MTGVFILSLVASTSLAAYVLGARVLGLSPSGLGRAFVHATEALGATLAFGTVNVMVGTMAALTWRSLTPWFASAYVAGDESLLVLSLLQGLVFTWWRVARARA